MKGDLSHEIRWFIMIILFVAILYLVILIRPRDITTDKTANIFMTKLEQINIPVKSVETIQDDPLQIVIVLQSSSHDNKTAPEDLWNKFLASREATLSYLNGPRVSNYKLIIVNTKGETISSEVTYLYPDLPSQNLTSIKQTYIDDSTAKKLIEDKFNTYGMKILTLEVTSEKYVRENTKFVEMQLTSPLDKVNQNIDRLILSLRPLLMTINEEQNAQISLFRLRITDVEGQQLVEYIYDLDTRTEAWSLSKEIKADWYPKPAPLRGSAQPFGATSTPIPQPYPPPSTNTPITTPIPTPPYP